MQKITVADVRTKSGGEGNKQWTLVIVTDTNGAEYTTFDTKLAALGPGSVLEIEPEITTKSGKTKVNIKEFKIISEAPPAPAGAAPTNGSPYKRDIEGLREEFRLRADLQAGERLSIERQTVFKGSMAVVTITCEGGLDKLDKELRDALIEMARAAVAWGRERFSAEPAPNPDKAPSAGDLLEFKTGVELVNYALKHGWTMDRLKGVGLDRPAEIKDVGAAAAILGFTK